MLCWKIFISSMIPQQETFMFRCCFKIFPYFPMVFPYFMRNFPAIWDCLWFIPNPKGPPFSSAVAAPLGGTWIDQKCGKGPTKILGSPAVNLKQFPCDFVTSRWLSVLMLSQYPSWLLLTKSNSHVCHGGSPSNWRGKSLGSYGVHIYSFEHHKHW